MMRTVILAAVCALAVGCGGDDNNTVKNGSNNGASNNGTNNGVSNNGTNNGVSNNGTNNGVSNNGTNNGASNNGTTGGSEPAECTPPGEFLGSCDNGVNCTDEYTPGFDAETAETNCQGTWNPNQRCVKGSKTEGELSGCCYGASRPESRVLCYYSETGSDPMQEKQNLCEAGSGTWCAAEMYE